ncbi:MAG: beta-propeller domain-containing protein [Chloroflexi bacterium]|nr:beta-propeller domain-containing protein [Chloroflexota bacterium]
MKGIRLFTVFLLIMGFLIGFACTNNTENYVSNGIKKFQSEKDLRSFLETKTTQNQSRYSGLLTWGVTKGMAEDSSQPTNTASAQSIDFSTTNIQVEGVDEADILKTDGKYIYIVIGNEIIIVEAYPPESAKIVSRIKLKNTPIEIFINDNRLIVFENLWESVMKRSYSYISNSQLLIEISDIENRQAPVMVREISADGNYSNSRMIGDYVYVIVNSSFYVYNEKDTSSLTLPSVYFEDQKISIPASDIYYSENFDYPSSFTTIMAINIQDNSKIPYYETVLLGYSSSVYVSLNNIYITFTEWSGEKENTSINRFSISSGVVKYQGSGTVPGHLLNQFSMDEYNGYFRVATTVGQVWSNSGSTQSKNNVYVLDAQLQTVGKVEDLAPGESIYSCRFISNKGYIVTFKKVDPLFVIDLTNPALPVVLGQLKITGYSDYLQPYDETHLIGIGKEAVAATQGDFAWYQGVKISLFDVSDFTNPREIAKYEIGDRGTDSPALRDHKALLFNKNLNLLVLPVTVCEVPNGNYSSANVYGKPVWDGVYVFDISPGGGLVLRGQITHFDNGYPTGGDYYYADSSYSIKRSLYIGNALYTVSDGKFKVHDLDDLDFVIGFNLK